MGTTHGMTPRGYMPPEYQSWRHMIQRCTNANYAGWRYYGGRGIAVCERWLRFENFFADLGPRPEGMTLDRINNDGNYEPGNCRWATWKQQRMNQRPRYDSRRVQAQAPVPFTEVCA